MPLQPKAWSVIIAGQWNRAILTPRGIATRIFHLDSDAPIEVQVPIDAILPYKVSHDRIAVTAGSRQLLIEPLQPTYEEIERAMKLARTAMEDLPETPYQAAGINIQFQSDEYLDCLEEVTANDWDSRLADEQFVITMRSTFRSLQWNKGFINLAVNCDSSGNQIHLNFERRSAIGADLIAWMNHPVSEIKEAITRILHSCGISAEEFLDV